MAPHRTSEKTITLPGGGGKVRKETFSDGSTRYSQWSGNGAKDQGTKLPSQIDGSKNGASGIDGVERDTFREGAQRAANTGKAIANAGAKAMEEGYKFYVGGKLIEVVVVTGAAAVGGIYADARAMLGAKEVEAIKAETNAAAWGADATKAPQLFRNLAPADDIVAPVLFPASQIQKVEYSGRLTYVVRATGELVIGRTPHTSLSRGAEVLAAGEARFVNGALRSLDNASGHYRPSGASAQQAAEAAFNRAGFDATGKYAERDF